MPVTDEQEIRTVTLSPWAGTRVTALIGFALGLALVLIFLMTGGGQVLLHRTVIIHTYMADGTGLIRTANVELNGIKVGKVKKISFSRFPEPARAIQVDMKIRKDYLSAIPIDSKAELTADNLLGDKYINITKGASPQSIEPGADLATQPPTANFDPGDLLASLQNILQRANVLLGQVEDPKTPFGQFVKGEDFYATLRDYVVGIQNTIHKYGNPRSELGKSVYGQALYREMRQRLLDIDVQIQQVQQNPWLAKSTQYDAWLSQAKTFRQSVAAFRESPMMKQDDFYNATRDALSNLDDTVRAMAAGPLLTGTELYESLNGSSRNTRDLLKDFRQNPKKYLRLKVF
jgi:phospholipid/cholesterol/gamma-HCH transport system substrate-binding protein